MVNMIETSQAKYFDYDVAVERIATFSLSTGLGCTISNVRGEVLHESGFGCKSCMICDAAGLDKATCASALVRGMLEAGRFQGKYVFTCPLGLACISVPIGSYAGSVVGVTAGPILMSDVDDIIAFDIKTKFFLANTRLRRMTELLDQMPKATPNRVTAFSSLLRWTVGAMTLGTAADRLPGAHFPDAQATQAQITSYILKRREGKPLPEYPVKTEKKLLASIAESDKARARKLLNELLGHILFSSDGDLDRIKSKTYELLVMISRGVIDAGASVDKILQLNHKFWRQAQSVVGINDLCALLSNIMNQYIDNIFDFADRKNVDAVEKAVQYIRKNYSSKITLEDAAKAVYLSPTYFGKVFQKSMGCSFGTYLNQLRIEMSKRYLLQKDVSMADVGEMVGFEDQSYFTKVFKRVVGVSPSYFRKNTATENERPPTKLPQVTKTI